MAPANYFVTTGYSRELGGAAKSIGLFREALDGEVISFGHRSQETQRLQVAKAASPFGYLYGTPSRTSLQRLERHFETPEGVISCHLLFRFHCDWVHRQAQSRDVPYWVVPHGALDPWVFSYRTLQKKAWLRLRGSRLFRDAAAVIFATRREAQKASAFYHGDNVRVVNWPVQLLDRGRAEAARRNVRQTLDLPSESRILLYLGRLHSMKRPAETIERFTEAKPPENCVLVLVGNESDVTIQQLESKVPPAMRSQVRVLGPRWGDQRDQLLLAADGFVSLSHRENFGHTAAEAMAAGLPVILSPGNDLVGEFDQHVPGYLIDDNGQNSETGGFAWFQAADARELRQIGECNRSWVDQHLRFETFKERLDAIREESLSAFKGRFSTHV